MSSFRLTRLLFLILSGLAAVGIGEADTLWTAGGVVVSNAEDTQRHPRVLGDGAGGVFICWEDDRISQTDIYAQHLDAAGSSLWDGNGVIVCDAYWFQDWPRMVSDGSTGAILAWSDMRDGSYGKIYAQRLNSSGDGLWTANGVLMCNYNANQQYLDMAADGAGGAVLVWNETRGGTMDDVYAQRVSGAGARLWGTLGVLVCNAADQQLYPHAVPDGSGGLLAVWEDSRFGNMDVYAQRIDAAGSAAWAANGVAVCNAIYGQNNPKAIPDGSGGILCVWNDFRGATQDIYAQHLNSSGAPQWLANGALICGAAGEQYMPDIVPDGEGGAIMVWRDRRSGNYAIYAQRVNPSGVAQWTANGVVVCSYSGSSPGYVLSAVSDGNQGAIVLWSDLRSGSEALYAQQINGSGAPLWTPDGVQVASAFTPLFSPTLAQNADDGAFVSWSYPSVGGEDIFAQALGASATATPTSSLTPTGTPTRTATVTHSPTASPTFTATLTASPTATPTATGSPSESPTPTATPSNTSSATETPTATPSRTSTATPTESATASFSATPAPSATTTTTPTPRGSTTATPTVSATPSTTPTGTPTPIPAARPLLTDFRNYPNPFAPGREPTTLAYTLSQNAEVWIDIYAYAGTILRTWHIRPGEEGGRGTAAGYVNRILWDGRNALGKPLAVGGYVCRITVQPDEGPRQIFTRKVGISQP